MDTQKQPSSRSISKKSSINGNRDSSGTWEEMVVLVNQTKALGKLQDLIGSKSASKQLKCDINKRINSGSELHETGYTLLHLSCGASSSCIESTSHLLTLGADPNLKDKSDQWTALHWAVASGNWGLLFPLVKNGGLLELQDSKLRTPLDLYYNYGKSLDDERQFVSVSKEFYSKNRNTERDVYTWGSGTNFQLGHQNVDVKCTPKRVRTLDAQSIVSLSTSKYHSVALNSQGELFSWGFGAGGRLGLGDEETQIFPERVVGPLGPKTVTMVSISSKMSAVITSDGQLYTWGTGFLGYQDDTSTSRTTALVPRRVKGILYDKFITKVAVSNHHTVVTTSNQWIYSWGLGTHGAHGHGMMDVVAPRAIAAWKPREITSFTVSNRATLILVGNEVYMFGYGKIGLLRFTFPSKTFFSDVVFISASKNRNIAVMSDGAAYFWIGDDKGSKPQLIPLSEKSKVVKAEIRGRHITLLTENGDVYESYEEEANDDVNRIEFTKVDLSHVIDISISSIHSAALVSKPTSRKFLNGRGVLSNSLFQEYVGSEYFSDFKFILDNQKEIPSHRIILVARSPFFKSLLSEESNTSTITLTNTNEEVLKTILNYIYCDKLEFASPQTDPKEVLSLAEKYELNHLQALIKRSMKTNKRSTVESTFQRDMRWAFNQGSYLHDIKITLGDQVQFGAHRVILASRSSYFHSLLHASMQETLQGLIQFEEVRPAIMKRIFGFIYTDEIPNLGLTDLLETLIIADQFLMDNLKQLCLDTLRQLLNVDILTTFLEIAETYGVSELKHMCYMYILSNIKLILNTPAVRDQISNAMLAEFQEVVKATYIQEGKQFVHINIMNTNGSHMDESTVKRARSIKKKLQQISQLEEKFKNGEWLTDDEQMKIEQKETLMEELSSLAASTQTKEEKSTELNVPEPNLQQQPEAQQCENIIQHQDTIKEKERQQTSKKKDDSISQIAKIPKDPQKELSKSKGKEPILQPKSNPVAKPFKGGNKLSLDEFQSGTIKIKQSPSKPDKPQQETKQEAPKQAPKSAPWAINKSSDRRSFMDIQNEQLSTSPSKTPPKQPQASPSKSPTANYSWPKPGKFASPDNTQKSAPTWNSTTNQPKKSFKEILNEQHDAEKRKHAKAPVTPMFDIQLEELQRQIESGDEEAAIKELQRISAQQFLLEQQQLEQQILQQVQKEHHSK